MESKGKWVNRGTGALMAVLLALTVPRYLRPTESATVVDSLAPNFNGTVVQSQICTELAAALPHSVFSEQHPSYKVSQNDFWAQQACEDKPTCVVRPHSTEEVSRVVTLLRAEDKATRRSAAPLRFSVRAGGHFASAGFASVDNGILIDLGLLNGVTVSQDRTETRIGTGARWLDVYSRLDKMGLAVAGGRDAHVGVGGLVLGGGISFYSPQVGMVCDNILSYEIVLANGTMATASETQNPDLWRALKGGSGNFGIVTHVTANTFPGSKVWGGYVYYLFNQAPKLIHAFHDFVKPENFDKHAAGPILCFAYMQKLGIKAAATIIVHTKPEPWPAAWHAFQKIWRIWNGAKVQALSGVALDLSSKSPMGNRQFQITTTVKNDLETLSKIVDEWDKSTKALAKASGLVTSIVLQPLSASMTQKGTPNALGLGARNSDEPLVVVLASAQWKHAAFDETVYGTLRSMIGAVDAFAQQRGTADRFRYLNYAAPEQKPFDGYGEENKKFLQDTSRIFDPEGFWQRAKVGGFKLDMY